MAIYHNSAELLGKVLEAEDVVIIDIPAKTFFGFEVKKARTFIGRVHHSRGDAAHVEMIGSNNFEPFAAIGMSEKERETAAAAIFGVPVDRIGGGWPVDRSSGDNALMRCTRLLMALYRHIEDGSDMVATVRADLAAEKAKLQAQIASLSDAYKDKIDAFNAIISDGDFGCKTSSVRKLGVFLMGLDPLLYEAYTALRRSEDFPKDAE